MPRVFTIVLIAIAVLVLGSLASGSGASAKPADDTPRECLGQLWSQIARGHLSFRHPGTGDPVEGFNSSFNPGLYGGASNLERFLAAIGFDEVRIEQFGCSVPIPVAAGFACIDFSSDPPCPPGDADGDGYLDPVELRLGSDPEDPDSTPESALLDEQTGSQTCSDRADNDGDGRTDRADEGCRLTCRDFSAGFDSRCRDDDGDGWLNYVEDLYGSDTGNAASTPEHRLVGETCDDGVDNDGDGDTDAADDGCGGEINQLH